MLAARGGVAWSSTKTKLDILTERKAALDAAIQAEQEAVARDVKVRTALDAGEQVSSDDLARWSVRQVAAADVEPF